MGIALRAETDGRMGTENEENSFKIIGLMLQGALSVKSNEENSFFMAYAGIECPFDAATVAILGKSTREPGPFLGGKPRVRLLPSHRPHGEEHANSGVWNDQAKTLDGLTVRAVCFRQLVIPNLIENDSSCVDGTRDARDFFERVKRAVGWVRVMCTASRVQPFLLLAMMLSAGLGSQSSSRA
jgi:hypothetical protein